MTTAIVRWLVESWQQTYIDPRRLQTYPCENNSGSSAARLHRVSWLCRRASLGSRRLTPKEIWRTLASQIATRENDPNRGLKSKGSEQKVNEELVDTEMSMDPIYSSFTVRRVSRAGMNARDPVGPEDFPKDVRDAFIAERNARLKKRQNTQR